jgi:hypothetical protein
LSAAQVLACGASVRIVMGKKLAGDRMTACFSGGVVLSENLQNVTDCDGAHL